MALVTLLSDFGTEDHYVAALKAAIFSADSNTNIIDISHHISPSNVGHAAHVLSSVFRDFPKGTVHLCAVDLNGKEATSLIAIQLEEHYFVGYDCGIFSLLSEIQPTEQVILKWDQKLPSTFKARDILVPAAVRLTKGDTLGSIGDPIAQINRLYARQLKTTKREIVGNILHIDHYGNLMTNIVKKEFDAINKINGGKPFEVVFGREQIKKIHTDFHEVESGDCFIFFNSNDRLQIGINKGNASELLGLHLDGQVVINFDL